MKTAVTLEIETKYGVSHRSRVVVERVSHAMIDVDNADGLPSRALREAYRRGRGQA